MSQAKKSQAPTATEQPAAPEPSAAVEQTAERYYWVMLHSKVNKHDPDLVKPKCNGEGLLLKRNTPVIVPERFLRVLDNAQEQRFEMVPGQPRKPRAPVGRYPYTVLRDRGIMGEATAAEFFAMKSAGTEARKRVIQTAAQPAQH